MRTTGLARAKLKIGLQNLAYNIRRLVTFQRTAAADLGVCSSSADWHGEARERHQIVENVRPKRRLSLPITDADRSELFFEVTTSAPPQHLLAL